MPARCPSCGNLTASHAIICKECDFSLLVDSPPRTRKRAWIALIGVFAALVATTGWYYLAR